MKRLSLLSLIPGFGLASLPLHTASLQEGLGEEFAASWSLMQGQAARRSFRDFFLRSKTVCRPPDGSGFALLAAMESGLMSGSWAFLDLDRSSEGKAMWAATRGAGAFPGPRLTSEGNPSRPMRGRALPRRCRDGGLLGPGRLVKGLGHWGRGQGGAPLAGHDGIPAQTRSTGLKYKPKDRNTISSVYQSLNLQKSGR